MQLLTKIWREDTTFWSSARYRRVAICSYISFPPTASLHISTLIAVIKFLQCKPGHEASAVVEAVFIDIESVGMYL